MRFHARFRRFRWVGGLAMASLLAAGFVSGLASQVTIGTPAGTVSGKRGPNPNNPPESLSVYKGWVLEAQAPKLRIALADGREITLNLTAKSMVVKDGRGVPVTNLFRDTEVEVECKQDPEARVGRLLAVRVKILPPGTLERPRDEDAAALPSVPRRAASPAAGPAAGARKPEEEDEGPPRLKRGVPENRPRRPIPGLDIPAPEPAARTKPAADRADASEAQPASPPPAVPDADPRLALLARARKVSSDLTAQLPNYVCQQYTTRSISRPSATAQWEAQDVVSAEVVYADGIEDYRNIAVNGKKIAKKMEETGGSWSTGEFGTILRNLMGEPEAAAFRFRKETRIAGVKALIFDYEVQRRNSTWSIMAETQSIRPAYRGGVWIDAQDGFVLRIEMEAVNLPDDFPFDTVETAVDYDRVRLGTRSFLLPVKTESLSCQRGTRMCGRNSTDFRNYRRFTADSTVTFDKQ